MSTCPDDSKSRRLIYSTVLILGTLVSGSVVILLLICAPAEPAYQGKTVGRWFHDMPVSPVTEKNEALQALVAMADRSAPFLAQEFTRRDSASRKSMLSAVRRLCQKAGIAFSFESEADRRAKARYVLTQLGPGARLAVPELVRIVQDKSCEAKFDALQLLGAIHSEPELVIPTLIECLRSADSRSQLQTCVALHKYGKQAAPAASALKDLVLNGEPDVKVWAALALGATGHDKEFSLQVLQSAATNSSIRTRVFISH
jgi:HEAT repeat protein